MSDNIPPFEIQAEILKRVPDVKSLLQFRAVSKAWKSLIDSPRFIADYNPQPPRHHIFIWYYHIRKNFVSIIDDDDDNDSSFAQHKSPLTINFSEYIKEFKVYGSSQGLFCFYRNFGKPRAYLWNPSIRKLSVAIDVPNVYDKPYKHVIGFGVSPYSSDPKLLKIQRVVNVLDLEPRLVELYSLSTGEWRTLSSEDLPRSSVVFKHVNLIYGDDHHVAIGNFIFWLAQDMKYENGGMHMKREVIMLFDMLGEKFMEVYLPDNVVTKDQISELSLFKIRESLAVVESYFSFSVKKHVIHVWMMEGGVSDSFTKMYTITRPDDALSFSLLAFRNNGHPIIQINDFKGLEELVVYEPDSEQFTLITASNSARYAGSYMETLLLLDR